MTARVNGGGAYRENIGATGVLGAALSLERVSLNSLHSPEPGISFTHQMAEALRGEQLTKSSSSGEQHKFPHKFEATARKCGHRFAPSLPTLTQ